jgi:peroxiredoxin
MRVWRLLAVLAVVGALTLTACGGGESPDRPASAAGDLDFSVATLDGRTFDGASLKGKPAVLWFWAPWCPTCVGQAKHVTELAATYSDKAAVIGVAGLDKVPAMHDFVKLTKVSGFPHLADEQGVVWKRFGVTAQSTFVVLDSGGAVAARGSLEPDELESQLDRLLEAAG